MPRGRLGRRAGRGLVAQEDLAVELAHLLEEPVALGSRRARFLDEDT
jgi:hypothetical protein